MLPLLVATGEAARRVQQELPQALVARLEGEDGAGVLYEALGDNAFCAALLDAIVRRRRYKGAFGELIGVPGRMLQHSAARRTRCSRPRC